MYVDDPSSSEILYEHYFSRLRQEIKNQLVLAITPLIGFSGEITISVQWDYWKTRGQKITSGSIDSSRNAKDPGRRRSNYPKK
ncbi:hypothetical protein Tco_0988716 [Tanacetum coccineum]|uniref:Uncharacterized protein n=1 Tax=Tanacetum coccineum TaxID=301880 RepID=A0ABQ5ESZ5_9ASTR